MLAHEGLSDGLRLLARVWRRKGVALLVSAPTFLALIAWIAGMEPRYTAEALVMLDRPRVEAIEGPSGFGATDPFLVRGEVDLLWSAAVAQRVVDERDLAASEEFATEEGGGPAALVGGAAGRLRAALSPRAEPDAAPAAGERRREVVEAYHDRLGIGSDGRSLAVRIAFEASGPELAAALANAHARAYIAIKSDQLRGGYAAALAELDEEIERSAVAAREADRAAARFLGRNLELLGAEEGAFGAAPATVGPLREDIADARRSIAELAATIEVLDALPPGVGAAALGGELGEALRSPVLERLGEREAAALVEVRRTEAAFGADAPATGTAREELAAVRAAVADETERVRDRLGVELRRLRGLAASLEALLRDQLEAGAERGQALAEFRALRAEAEARRLRHEALLERQGELALADGIVGADAVLVAPALPPLEPSAPRTTLLALVAAMVAAAAGVAAALAADALLGGARGGELARRTGVPDLAAIPLPRRPDGRMVRDPRVWAGLRTLRARLDGMARDGRLVVALADAGRRDDRAAVAMGLAVAFAASGSRTVLLDADRSAAERGAVLPAFDAPVGATSVARGEAPLDAVLIRSVQPNLDILPVGRLLPGDAEALSRPGLEALLGQLAQGHARIVVIAPHLRSPADVADAARCADAVVIVLERSRSALRRLREGAAGLARFGVEPAGFALTERLPRKGGREAHGVGYAEPPATLRAASDRRDREPR